MVIISVMFLENRHSNKGNYCNVILELVGYVNDVMTTYGSLCVQSKLGPRTIAILPGVILFAS